jgi:hypothetical protein
LTDSQQRLQVAIDELLSFDHGEIVMARDWVILAHVNKLNDLDPDAGTLHVERGPNTSIFTAIGLIEVANSHHGYEVDDNY